MRGTGRFASFVVVPAVIAVAGCHGKKEPSAVDAAAPAPSSSVAAAPSAPANATPLPAASIEQWVNPEKLPPYTGPTGSLEGTIRISGPPSPDVPVEHASICPDAVGVYGKLFREGPAAPDGTRPVADAIVAVTGYKDAFIPERHESKLVTIRGCAFDARTITMTIGQRLDVKNETNEFWAPSLERMAMPALMIAPPHGDPVHLYPQKPGYDRLVDRMKHTWARADVFVVLQPLHTVSDLQGHYRIDGIPVGKLKVNTRLPLIGQETSKDVEILAGVVQKADLVLKYVPRPPASPVPAPPTVDGGRPHEPIK